MTQELVQGAYVGSVPGVGDKKPWRALLTLMQRRMFFLFLPPTGSINDKAMNDQHLIMPLNASTDPLTYTYMLVALPTDTRF